MAMDRYCVMGNPVEHSKSPWIHARFAALTGEPVEYGKRLVPVDGFAAALQAFRAEGGKGCNVTVPFKFEAAKLVAQRSARAALAGACNTLRFDAGGIYGDNTDGLGLVHDLQDNAGVALAGRELLLIGAGGAAAGVLGPLVEAKPRRIVIANRTVAKAQALVAAHEALAEASSVQLEACVLDAVPGAFDVVVNGTATSLSGAGVPVAASVLRPGALACDMMYGPAAEGFLQWARDHGAVGRDGLGMLVEQAAEAFLVWRGVRPPSGAVLAELRRELAR
ncbi:shikimate dehydrogenase [Ramlibacter sp.]|uniref:shikimate dehydrogenase n=1 Tax=Ramlibacter sp. TaxID=1917967 RepID=UPI0039C91533